jgi:hypothetical protein
MRTHLRRSGYVLAVATPIALAVLCVGMRWSGPFLFLPKGWPEELVPYLEKGRTYGTAGETVHEIPFAGRDEFERIWPTILTLKSPGSPLVLYRPVQKADRGGFYEGAGKPSVRILGPTESTVTIKGVKQLHAGPPWPDSIRNKDGMLPEYVVGTVDGWVPADKAGWGGVEHRARVDIELVADGQVIDLNRIPLPPDTPIIDRRWTDLTTRPASRPASQPGQER